MQAHPVPTLTHNTHSATYELGHVKVQVTDTSINGDNKRMVRIIDKSAKNVRGLTVMSSLDMEGPAAKDLAALLGGLSL